MSVPNGRHYAVLEAVGDAPAGGAPLTDGDLDRADRWGLRRVVATVSV